MHSFYEFEQHVKMKQEELRKDRYTPSRITRLNILTAFSQRIRSIFYRPALLQDQVCCINHKCCIN